MNNATDEDYLRDEAQNDLTQKCQVDATYHPNCSSETHYEPSTGCWIDGHWGHYGASRLVEIAQDYGFEISALDESALWAYKNGDEEFQDEQTGEYHHASDWMLMQGGLTDEAEDYLNENIARQGYYFGWVDGEFFYMSHEWWGEEE